ncbi:MAG TPA: hypothetical protein VJ914_01600 [Pseudonocardiaceae bacterium]|nr:hypothetical protein [Pseudonocardiaceae bacterium]
MSSRKNWPAVSAIAACASALIAFLALATHSSAPPAPTPPTTTVAPAPAQQSTQGNVVAPTTPLPTAGPSAACQPADAAITTYRNTVGSSWYSRMIAASRARDEIEMAGGQSGGGPVMSDLQALATDFQELFAYAQAQLSSSYNPVVAQTNSDIQALNADCRTG